MNLRTRLILTFLAVVSLLAVGNLVTFYINRGIQRDVSRLDRSSRIAFQEGFREGQVLEIEGFWHEQGILLAEEIDKLPTFRRPKLRGEIQKLDPDRGIVTLYGMPVRVTEQTAFLDEADAEVGFDGLWVGRRVEVSCAVDSAGLWFARKIKTRGVKKSDKIKGAVTRAAVDGSPPDTLEISGLPILVVRETAAGNPQSYLNRIEKALQMTQAVQTCRTAANDLLKEKYRVVKHVEAGEFEAAELARSLVRDAAVELMQGHDDFEHLVRESRLAAGETAGRRGNTADEQPAANGKTEFALWLDPLALKRVALSSHLLRFLELVESNLDDAQVLLREVLEPQIQDDILPLVHAYQADAEESLAREVQAISARAETSNRLGIAANVVALVAALLLGMAVSRHISRPITALKEAALKIGRGHLDTRVAIHSKDELGVLADTFNQMARELADTTVSMSNLANVIDSMAGTLIILSPEGEITSVNQAVRSLLGYEKAELIGQPFTLVCPGESGEGERIVATDARGIVANVEKAFRAKDGTIIPVSFSGAALRSENAPVQGYVCVAQDLTERKRIEEQIRQSLSEKELLLHELHHRVKNNLQVISSLLDLQSSFIDDEGALSTFRESQSRIRSMALIHEQLYHTTDLDHIDFKTYLERLAAHLFDSFGVRPDMIALRLEVDDVELNLDQAVACGLIVNELVTNALKYAFPGGAKGEIHIRYSGGENDTRILSVSDDGRGMGKKLDPGLSQSLGMSLVETLTRQLRGHLVFEHERGTVCRVEFPARAAEQESRA